MAAIANDFDRTLQAAVSRYSNPPNADIILTDSAPIFKIPAGGDPDPAPITFTAKLIDLAGPATFVTTGCTVTVVGNVATLTYANMPGVNATVRATLTENGQTYNSNLCFVTKLADGTSGAGTPGVDGARGAGGYYATGSAWSDALADATTPGGNVPGDEVTISNGTTFIQVRQWNGSAWVVTVPIFDGGGIFPGSVTANKINSNGLSIKLTDGTMILDAGGGGLQPGFEAPGTKNNLISIAANGALSNAGGGAVTIGGLGYAGDLNATRDVSLVASPNLVLVGNTITRPVGGGWDAGASSLNGHTGGAFTSFSIEPSSTAMAGLNSDPFLDDYFGGIDYAWFSLGNGGLQIYLSGTGYGGGTDFGPFNGLDVFGVVMDGSYVKFTMNGDVKLALYVPSNPKLHFDSSVAAGGVKNIRFGPLTSNNFDAVGGPNKPENGATVGAPSGTMVGGTLAQTVESNASTALANAATANAELANKLSKNSDDILGSVLSINAVTAPAGFRAGNLTWNNAGARTGGNGVAMTPSGLVGYNSSGVLTFSINSSTGSAYFGGELGAAYGSFGAVTIAAGGSISSGQTAFHTGNGYHLSFAGGVAKFSVGNSAGAYIYFDGSVLRVSGATYDTFTLTLANVSSTGGGGDRYFSTPAAMPVGGKAPFKYSWTFTSEPGSTGISIQSGVDAAVLNLKCISKTAGSYAGGNGVCTIVDADNRTVSGACYIEAIF